MQTYNIGMPDDLHYRYLSFNLKLSTRRGKPNHLHRERKVRTNPIIIIILQYKEIIKALM